MKTYLNIFALLILLPLSLVFSQSYKTDQPEEEQGPYIILSISASSINQDNNSQIPVEIISKLKEIHNLKHLSFETEGNMKNISAKLFFTNYNGFLNWYSEPSTKELLKQIKDNFGRKLKINFSFRK